MADPIEFAQARAWLYATAAPDIDTLERKHDEVEGHFATAERISLNDSLSAAEIVGMEREAARWAKRVEQLRDEMVTQWKIRDESQLSPELRRAGEVASARAWLGEVDPDAQEKWILTRAHAANRAEVSIDDDRLVSLWQASNGAAKVDQDARSVFDAELAAKQESRAERAHRAQAWLQATDPRAYVQHEENRVLAEDEADAACYDGSLVKKDWLDETGCLEETETEDRVAAEQLRAETAAHGQRPRLRVNGTWLEL